jgi:linoleate 10R-lipoxygenase
MPSRGTSWHRGNLYLLLLTHHSFRLSTPAFGVLRAVAAKRMNIKDGPRDVAVQNGDTLFVNFVTAGLDPSKFPDPEEIRLDRPEDFYIHHGWGPHACLGRPIVTVAAASMLRTVARLGNLRCAPGPAGEMKSKVVGGAFKEYLAQNGSDWGPFPCSKYRTCILTSYANLFLS